MTNALLGIVAIAFLWFTLPVLVALGALTCCLVANVLPGRRRAAPRQSRGTVLDVHHMEPTCPRGVQVEVRANQCTARVA